MLNGIILMHMLKFIIQDLKLGADFFQCRIILKYHGLPTVNILIALNCSFNLLFTFHRGHLLFGCYFFL